MSHTKDLLMTLQEERLQREYEWDEVPERFDFFFAEVEVFLNGEKIKARSENFESASEAKEWAEELATDYAEDHVSETNTQVGENDRAEIRIYRLGDGRLEQHDEYHSELLYEPTEILSLTLNYL